MKIISTKEYNKLKKTQSAYLDLLMKPLQGVFEKVTDDDLLRENGLLNAENERLNNTINELEKELINCIKEAKLKWGNQLTDKGYLDIQITIKNYEDILDKLQELKGVDKE